MIINYLKNIGYTFLIILITNIVITLLSYFNILNGNILNIINIITIYIAIIITSYLIGRKANKKGYLEGIKFGSIIMIIILLLNVLIFKPNFKIISIFYYISIIFISMIGSMIGITKRKI